MKRGRQQSGLVVERSGTDTGATMIEYGLMLVGIAIVVAVAAAALGLRVGPIFDGVMP